MKNRLFLLLSSILLILAVFPVSSAGAASSSLTVSAQVNNSTKAVTITGMLSSGADKQVSVLVTNPSGSVDYIDQTTSGSGGSYEFHYTLDESESGTYAVTVGGSDVSSPARTVFTYNKPAGNNTGGGQQSGGNTGGQQPGGNTEGGTQPTNPVADSSKSFTVDESSLKPNSSGKQITVNVPAQTEAVLLPYNAGSLLGTSNLTLEMGQMSVIFQPEVLAGLQNLISAKDLNDSQISLALKSGSQAEVNKTLSGAQALARIEAAGQTASFDLGITTKDGLTSQLSDFPKPVEISLGYDQDVDANLLGVYYHNEQSGQWEYIGGALDENSHRITANLTHPGTYAVLKYEKDFSDVPANYWATETIKTLAAKHVINGITVFKFAPKNTVTRAEFTTLLVRALGLKETAQAQPFKDVPSVSWYAGDVGAAYEAGIINGQSANTFLPNDNISREEMAIMLVRAFDYANTSQTTEGAAGYTDQGEISSWAKAYVDRAAEAGLMTGADNHLFLPKALTTRAESAQAILNMLTQLEG